MAFPHPKRSSFPVIAAVLLSLLVLGADVLLSPSLDRENFNDDFYPHGNTDNFLPDFNYSQEIVIVDIFPLIENGTLDSGMQYALASLQGLVNRESARVLLDFEGWLHGEPDLDYWDHFMNVYVPYYDLDVMTISHTEFLEQFRGYASGMVVYDEDNEHTINVASTLAGINGWLVADKGTGAWLESTYGLEIKENLHSGWDGSRADIYERSFDRYYESCYQGMLFESIPSEWGTDYLIASRGWIFCLNPGPFTTPAEKALTLRIMEETPADIPVVGWFEQPTGVEENYMIQLASRSGKIFLGGHRFPNKSFFAAFEIPEKLENPIRSDYFDDGDGGENGTGYPDIDPIILPGTDSSEYSFPLPPDTGNKIYISLAVTDGDNLGFMTRKMRKEMWNSDVRGTIPMAWSVNPLLGEIIPCLLDFYYSTPTENDTFIAGPSGIGYFNPDFASDEQLDLWLARTAYGMETLDLRHVWLLNSFTTYETYYSERVLSAYTRELWPDGMMLDYGDVPEGRKMWMQEGDDGDNYWTNPSTPVIRSMHIWGDTENFVGKLIVESQVTPDDRPIFAFAPIMSADLTLESIADLLDDLEKSEWALGRDVEFVSIDDLFYLMERHFVERARGEKDTLAFGLGDVFRRTGYQRMDEVRRDSIFVHSEDDPGSPEEKRKFRHYSASQAYSVIESGKQTQDFFLYFLWSIFLFLFLLSSLAYSLSWKTFDSSDNRNFRIHFIPSSFRRAFWNSSNTNHRPTILYNGLLLITTMIILFMTSLHVLYLNFWHYAYFGVGILGVLVTPRLLNVKHWILKKSGISGEDHGEGGEKGKGSRWIDPIQKNDLAITGVLLAVMVALLPFGSFAFSIIPYLCVRLFRRSSVTLGTSTLGWLLIAMVTVVISSLVLREYTFPVASIALIWFGAGIWGTRNRTGEQDDGVGGEEESSTFTELPDNESHDDKRSSSDPPIPAPLLTALLLSLFIVIIDIPFNRYFSMATDYRMEYLEWRFLILWVPLNSSIGGFLLFRFFRNRKIGDMIPKFSTLGLVVVSSLLLLQPFMIAGHRLIPYLLTLFGTMVVTAILGLASKTHTWQWTGRGKRVATWVEPRFFEFLVILLILGLIIVTMPPIAFTVYAFSLPIWISYILYSLPAVLILISLVLVFLSLQITPQSKVLIEP